MIPYFYLVGAYLVGAIPFGYLIARSKGIDLFQMGSGNIGATNVGRVLGRKYGILVFVLDFSKGALPVALTSLLSIEDQTAFGPPDTLRTLAALFAFLGHLFPIYLGFRGGKGVATGAGTIIVLVPGPAIIALFTWFTTVCSLRMVSLGSVWAVVALVIARLLGTPNPFAPETLSVTLFCIAGTILVIVKHRANLKRILQGTESKWEDKTVWQNSAKTIHLLAIGLWFGSAIFFNFIAALAINQSFKQTIATAPNDRTANLPITEGLTEEQKNALATSLFGAAVGPLFPRFFILSGICAGMAWITALRWFKEPGKVNRWRVYLLTLAATLVAISWPISQYVSELRLERYSSDTVIANAAKEAFGLWHLVSLLLSAITAVIVGVVMILAAKIPTNGSQSITLSDDPKV
jgi:acyl phosphate:glycerol-3-phosphate acyltransferase